MMRSLVALICLGLCAMASALRAQEPQISFTADQEEVLVGQPFILRLEILVPTFMTKAPIFPSFEVPGLIVRLPERSTAPVSRRINGETWAGVTRTYRIYPMQAGITNIPPQQLSLVYKNTDTNEDIPLTVEVPATQVVAVVPPGARGLDPLIVAQDLRIEQSWQLAEGDMDVGDAVVRKLEIFVDGASALFVPPLLEAAAPQSGQDQPTEEDAPPMAGFLSYPEDARVTEAFDGGVMSGTRTETVSYIAQSGGIATFPTIELRWYNLERDTVEDIVLDGQAVTVTMPPRVRAPIDRQKVAFWGLMLGLAAAILWAAHRWLWPAVDRQRLRARAAYDRSVHAAQRMAERRAAEADLGGLLQALALRAARGRPSSHALDAAMENLTRAVYRDGTSGAALTRQWADVRQQLRRDSPGVFRGKASGPAKLAPLNPFS